MQDQENDEKAILEENYLVFPKNQVIYSKLAWNLSQSFFDESGGLNLKAIEAFENSILIYEDAHIGRIKKICTLIRTDPYFKKKLLDFDLPIHPQFEVWVKQSLQKNEGFITKNELRKTVLQALLSYLRQTVGSCFATAPCLYVLERHPDYFLEDLFMMSKKGRLERTLGGELIKIPMAPSVGEHFLKKELEPSFLYDSHLDEFIQIHEVKKPEHPVKTFEDLLSKKLALQFYFTANNPIQKIWEYTVASFCDAKGEFSQTTLFLTLGLDRKIPEGLGQFFEQLFQKKLDEKTLLLKQAAEQAFLAEQRLVMAENLARRATNENALHRAKSEMTAANFQYHTQMMDVEDLKKEQSSISGLYQKQMEKFHELIPQFFQESYDPDLVSMKTNSDDAPAGFRLFVRDNQLISRFKPINTSDDFISALKTFFEKWEQELLTDYDIGKQKNFVNDCVTQTIQLTSSKEFIEKTLERAKRRHPKALPWAYVSGGTLETLLKTYFRKEILHFKTISSDSILSFFVELIDHFKALPEKQLEGFRSNPYLPLLIETKTHACSLMPGLKFFRKLWESTNFTYTEVRDFLVEAGKKAYFERFSSYIIPQKYFESLSLKKESMSVREFLELDINQENAFYILSSFLMNEIKDEDEEETLGFCIIGDTNWTLDQLAIGFNPFISKLQIFAIDPKTSGFFLIENMNELPQKWKIFEDLKRGELITSGIKI